MNPTPAISNLFELITSAKLDPEVGIRVAHLTGSEKFSLFGAEIAPHKAIGAHYHIYGEEIYQLVEGKGVMYIGKPDDNGNVAWDLPFNIGKGDCYTVSEGHVHQLFNNSNERLIVIFGCPKSHLSTDRIVVKGFNG